MNRRLLERFLLLLVILASIFLVERISGAVQASSNVSAASETENGGEVESGLIPRFIDFDIGAATVRSGATHQGDTGGIPDIAPFVLFPTNDASVTLVTFTIPPDFNPGGDFDVRLVWSPYSANTFPCFFVLSTELVGFGPRESGSSAALFDPYWPGDVSTSDEYIVQVQNSSIQETIISFQGYESFAAQPGDPMTFTLWRMGTDMNDTCDDTLALRSISVTYQGLSTYLPVTLRSE